MRWVASSRAQRLNTHLIPASRRRSRWRSARGLDQWRVDRLAPSQCGNNRSVASVVQPLHQPLTLGPPTIAQVSLSLPFPFPLLEGCRLRRLWVFTAVVELPFSLAGCRPHRWRSSRMPQRCRRRRSRSRHTRSRTCRSRGGALLLRLEGVGDDAEQRHAATADAGDGLLG